MNNPIPIPTKLTAGQARLLYAVYRLPGAEALDLAPHADAVSSNGKADLKKTDGKLRALMTREMIYQREPGRYWVTGIGMEELTMLAHIRNQYIARHQRENVNASN